MQGISVARHKVLAAGIAGALAGIGGGLYAHLTTYVEPRIFDVMLGVHSLAYGLIGGLGTALGPLLGVLIDIGLLESIRALAGYRMIIFGGLVALLLIVRPRGLLDETGGAQDRPRLAATYRHGHGGRTRDRRAATPERLEDGHEVSNLQRSGARDARALRRSRAVAHAQVRAKADVACKPAAEKLQYDCIIKLANARTNEPLSGLALTVGADMPSMPAAHNVRPVEATEDAGEGDLSRRASCSKCMATGRCSSIFRARCATASSSCCASRATASARQRWRHRPALTGTDI